MRIYNSGDSFIIKTSTNQVYTAYYKDVVLKKSFDDLSSVPYYYIENISGWNPKTIIDVTKVTNNTGMFYTEDSFEDFYKSLFKLRKEIIVVPLEKPVVENKLVEGVLNIAPSQDIVYKEFIKKLNTDLSNISILTNAQKTTIRQKLGITTSSTSGINGIKTSNGELLQPDVNKIVTLPSFSSTGTGSSTALNTLKVINVLDNGILRDGTDQSSKIQALLSSNTTLYFPYGVYTINNPILLGILNNLKILGDKGTIFVSSGRNILNTKGDLNNITFQNIEFISTSTITTDDYENSLFHCDGYNLKDITFEECYFSAPLAQTNGIKMTNQGAKRTERIRIIRCEFDVLGRMGIELQNHVYDEVSRYKDVWVDQCIFNRVGEISYGMGVSFSGKGSNIKTTNSLFSNNGAGGSGTAIEYVGCSNSLIANNTFDNNYKSLLVGGTSYITSEDIVVTNNTTIRKDIEGNAFQYVNGLQLLGNKLTRYINIHNVKNAQLIGEMSTSDAYTIYDIENSQNIRFYGGTLIQSEDWLSVVYLRDNLNKDIKFFGTQIFRNPNSSLAELHPNASVDPIKYHEVDLFDFYTKQYVDTLNLGVESGTTANRPTLRLTLGKEYFDTTLNKPIWYNGSSWVDSGGTVV